jgi:PAS domain S-box-containing protein
MKKLTEYLIHLKQHHLREVAEEVISLSSEMNFQFLSRNSDSPSETLMKRAVKLISDFTDALVNQTYDQMQAELIKKYMDLETESNSTDLIRSGEMVLIYSLQRRVFRKFLHTFTQNLDEALVILNELEILNLHSEQAGIRSLLESVQKTGKELEQSNIFLSAVLENLPNMIFVKDAKDLRFVRLNKAGEDLLGFPVNDLIGKNDYDFFPKEQANFFVSKDRAVLRKGKLCDIAEEPIQTKHLGRRWLHTKKISIPGIDGKPAYLLGISEDITEKKKKDDALNELNLELEAFSYSISHDLRAPLRAMNGYAQILEEDYASGINEEGRRLLKAIKYNSQKMGILIDELLTFSRLGRKEIKKSTVDMNELTEGVIRELNNENPNKAQIHFTELHPVVVDYGLIHQVMHNLLSNAIKYSSGKETPDVEISSRIEEKEVIYEVKDNGVGFNMKYADKLFGVFQRLHNSDEFEGVGVGLAIVKRVVIRHGGSVWAEGVLNKGATFGFSIPFK